jgi:hypothetical protein
LNRVKRFLCFFAVFSVFLIGCPTVAAAADMKLETLTTGMAGTSVTEAEVFPKTDKDVSLQYLSYIFGTVGTSLSVSGARKNELLGPIFALFNAGIIVFVGFLLGYTALGGIMRAGQEGKVGMMGSGSDFNPWQLVRMCAGVGMLVPAWSGYSLIQLMVMATAVKGVSFANGVWNKTVDYLHLTGGLYAQYQPPIGNELGTYQNLATLFTTNTFQYFIATNFCAHKVNSDSDVKRRPFITAVSTVTSVIATVNYARTDSAPDGLCKPATFTFTSIPSTSESLQKLREQIIVSVLGNFVNTYYNDVGTWASAESIPSTQEQKNTYIMRAGSLYASLQGMYTYRTDKTSFTDSTIQAAKDAGWILAAQNFLLLSKDFEKVDADPVTLTSPHVVVAVPAPEPLPASELLSIDTIKSTVGSAGEINSDEIKANLMPDTGASGMLKGSDCGANADSVYCKASDALAGYNAAIKALKAGNGFDDRIDQHSLLFPWKSLTVATDELGVLLATVFTEFIGCTYRSTEDACSGAASTKTMATGILGMVKNYENGIAVNPLAVLIHLGNTCLTGATTFMMDMLTGFYDKSKDITWSYFGVNLAVGLVGAIVSGLFAANESMGMSAAVDATAETLQSLFMMLQSFDMWSLTLWVPIATSIGTMIFSLGVMLAIYVPFIPILIYVFSALGWIISVIEAMVAAPLVALGVTHPEGHDLLGKAEQSMMLLFSVFMRPVSITIGFVTAIMLLYVAYELFNYSFLYLISSSFSSVTDSTRFVQMVTLLSLFMVYVYSLLSVVNYCFSLVYHIPDKIMRWIGGPQDQSKVEQMMGKAQGEAQQMGGKLGEAAGGAASSGANSASQFRVSASTGSGAWGEDSPGAAKAGQQAAKPFKEAARGAKRLVGRGGHTATTAGGGGGDGDGGGGGGAATPSATATPSGGSGGVGGSGGGASK